MFHDRKFKASRIGVFMVSCSFTIWRYMFPATAEYLNSASYVLYSQNYDKNNDFGRSEGDGKWLLSCLYCFYRVVRYFDPHPSVRGLDKQKWINQEWRMIIDISKNVNLLIDFRRKGSRGRARDRSYTDTSLIHDDVMYRSRDVPPVETSWSPDAARRYSNDTAN